MLKKLLERLKISFCCKSKCSLNEDKIEIDIDGDGKTDLSFEIDEEVFKRRKSL